MLLCIEDVVGNVLQQLGTTYRLHGKYILAAQHLDRALELRERIHGRNSAKVAETLSSLTVLYHWYVLYMKCLLEVERIIN